MALDSFGYEYSTIHRLTVHAGTFHSDDVFCGAAASLLNPGVEIRRVAKADVETDLAAGEIVADIGFGPFDHHQKDCPLRDDGVRHCGASRLWLVFGPAVVKQVLGQQDDALAESVSRVIYNGMLHTIAALDNGDSCVSSAVYSVASMVESFRPNWDEDISFDQGYLRAVDCMKTLLKNEIFRAASACRAESYVRQRVAAMEDGVVVLEHFCPWKPVVMAEPSARAVVYPSLRGGWNAEPVPNEKEELTYRVHVPDAWRGTSGEAAGALCQGMTFCHAKGFLIAFDTRENAVRAAKQL